jgi:hypothetical protein
MNSRTPRTSRAFVLLVVPAAIALATTLPSYGTGAIPGTTGIMGTVPFQAARQVASCGQCHRTFPGGLGLSVTLAPTEFVLTPSQSISITTSAVGGQTHAQNWGGFLVEATNGTIAAGTNSQVDPSGRFATHLLASQSNNRSWTYGFTAPATPGLVEVFTVVNTVNGDGRAGGEDFWGFHGFSSSSSIGTPVRLFVNAPGVTARGAGCRGRFGSLPILGAATSAAIGTTLNLELHGAVPNAATTLWLGANPTFASIDLTPIGVAGCSLHVEPLVQFALTTSNGDLLRAEGTATFALPIPNNLSLVGLPLQFQAAMLEPGVARALPLTLTNGLAVTVQ